jgi:hypothetical protein
MTHSLMRSIGWHLGTVLVDALGPLAVVIAVAVLAVYGVRRLRRHR